MGIQSLDKQIKEIRDLKTQNIGLINNIEAFKDRLNSYLNHALSNGMPIEIYNEYIVSRLNSLYSHLDDMSSRIQREDNAYLTELEIKLKNAREE